MVTLDPWYLRPIAHVDGTSQYRRRQNFFRVRFLASVVVSQTNGYHRVAIALLLLISTTSISGPTLAYCSHGIQGYHRGNIAKALQALLSSWLSALLLFSCRQWPLS